MDRTAKQEIKYTAPDSGTILIGILVVIITLGESNKKIILQSHWSLIG